VTLGADGDEWGVVRIPVSTGSWVTVCDWKVKGTEEQEDKRGQ